MYTQFFGLEDEPFRLTPDPRYLFLSVKHAEALAHLRLGLIESSGFVCITGDVGTGKTTLLRAFLDELGSNVDAVYVLLPPLSVPELLRKICHDFGVQVTAEDQSSLVEALHRYVLGQHQAGRKCIIVLDEAQALSVDLLEQIRLLLNLETATEKLLRIVLVGQPQLRKLLLDPNLAQLNQRITLRWHLGPLSSSETTAYVAHRLAVASHGQARTLFSQPALRLLHSVTGGVPRLINMVAHRALLAAFVAREARVTRRFVARAYREIQAVPLPGTLSTARKAAVAAAGLAIGVGLVAFGGPRVEPLLSLWSAPGPVAPAPMAPVPQPPAPVAPPPLAPASVAGGNPQPAAVSAPAPREAAPRPADVVPAPVLQAAAREPARPQPLSSAELARHLGSLDARASARSAASGVIAAWHERPLAADESPEHLDQVAWRRGLQEVSVQSDRGLVRVLDLPAVVALRSPASKEVCYAALTGLDGSQAVLSIGGRPALVDSTTLDAFWQGTAYVLWRDFEILGPALHSGARGVGVVRLQALLRRVGVLRGEPTGVFDANTEAAVRRFQDAHSLERDGIVGPLTSIVLYSAAGGYGQPALATKAHVGP
jgi:general secretion pathway protein A